MRRIEARDIALSAFALLLQSLPFVFAGRHPGHTWTLLEYAAAAATAVPLLWRRLAPLTCLLVTVLGVETYAFVGAAGPPQPVWYGGLIAMYTVGALAARPQRIAALAIIPVGVVVAVGSVSTGLRETLTWGAAYALGAMMRARRTLATENARRSAELAAERERTRIARELHDILGHAFSVMVVQSEAGAMTAEPDSPAQATFRAIATTGRDAMTQLRATIGTLRVPDPSLADLGELVRRAGSGGMRASLSVSGEPRPLAPDVQAAGYRVVQEALTNSLKHSGATAVEVAVAWRADGVRLTISDDGTGPDPARHGQGPGPGLDPGSGLDGMVARVAEVGGTVRYGARRGGRGFVVEAALP